MADGRSAYANRDYEKALRIFAAVGRKRRTAEVMYWYLRTEYRRGEYERVAAKAAAVLRGSLDLGEYESKIEKLRARAAERIDAPATKKKKNGSPAETRRLRRTGLVTMALGGMGAVVGYSLRSDADAMFEEMTMRAYLTAPERSAAIGELTDLSERAANWKTVGVGFLCAGSAFLLFDLIREDKGRLASVRAGVTPRGIACVVRW